MEQSPTLARVTAFTLVSQKEAKLSVVVVVV